MSMCKTGSLANLITYTMTTSRNNSNNTSSPQHQLIDISYFLWLLKFLVSNFVLKRLEDSPASSSRRNEDRVMMMKNDDVDDEEENPVRSAAAAGTQQLGIWSTTSSSGGKKSSTLKQTFFNDGQQAAAVATKHALLSYDLLAFLCFLMLTNFERLLFDSNAQNMTMLRFFRSSSSKRTTSTAAATASNSTTPPGSEKLVNARSLKLFYLSLSCVYEIIECINLHLEYLNSSQYLKVHFF